MYYIGKCRVYDGFYSVFYREGNNISQRCKAGLTLDQAKYLLNSFVS